MSYHPSSTTLGKWQWQLVQNPACPTTGCQGEAGMEEEADNSKLVITVYSPYISHKIKWALQNYSESGKVLRIKELLNYMFFLDGFTEAQKTAIRTGLIQGRNKFVNKEYEKLIPIDNNFPIAKLKYNTSFNSKGIVFYLVSGTAVPNIEEPQQIKPPYIFERIEYIPNIQIENQNNNNLGISLDNYDTNKNNQILIYFEGENIPFLIFENTFSDANVKYYISKNDFPVINDEQFNKMKQLIMKEISILGPYSFDVISYFGGNYDAGIISIFASLVFVGVSIDFVFIWKGEDKGIYYYYTYYQGLSNCAGISINGFDIKKDKDYKQEYLIRKDFEGWSYSFSVGASIVSYNYLQGFCCKTEDPLFSNLRTYYGNSIGVGWSKSISPVCIIPAMYGKTKLIKPLK